jgi:dynactin complex subunit
MIREHIISTTICRDGKAAFHVSTINRNRSAPEAYDSVYAETMVFARREEDESEELNSIAHQSSSFRGDTLNHMRVVRMFLDHGRCTDNDDEDDNG